MKRNYMSYSHWPQILLRGFRGVFSYLQLLHCHSLWSSPFWRDIRLFLLTHAPVALTHERCLHNKSNESPFNGEPVVYFKGPSMFYYLVIFSLNVFGSVLCSNSVPYSNSVSEFLYVSTLNKSTCRCQCCPNDPRKSTRRWLWRMQLAVSQKFDQIDLVWNEYINKYNGHLSSILF